MNSGDYLKLSITDNGCGIPPEMLNRIFDPYFTIKPTGDRAAYYRRKFGAVTLPTTATELILSFDPSVCRKHIKNIQITEIGTKAHLFKIKGVADNRQG